MAVSANRLELLQIADAVARGAAALVIARPIADPESMGDVTIVRVAEPLAALGARIRRARGCSMTPLPSLPLGSRS